MASHGEPSDLPVLAVVNKPTGPSGHSKRQEAARLPKVFLCYSAREKIVFGAVRFERALRLSTDDPFVYWSASRFVRMPPAPITGDMIQYHSGVFSLKPDAEKHVRSIVCLVGGALNHHFPEHAAVSWKVWRFTSVEEETTLLRFDGIETLLKFPASYARMAGVIPDIVPRLPDREGELELAAAVVASSDSATEPPAEASDFGGASAGADPNLAARGVGFLQGLHTPATGGTVTHRFTVDGLLSCLRLASHLKPSSTVADALGAAAPLLLGPAEGHAVERSVSQGQIPLPSLDIMRMARVRLDLMSIMFQRQIFLKFSCRRYLLVDASTKFGTNYLCVREDRVLIPRSDNLTPEFRVAFDINMNFETRLCPLSSLGLGHASAVKKSLNCANIYLMESAGPDEFHQVRSEVRGYTSDQGTEKEIGEGPVTVIPQFRDMHVSASESYMYPRCLTVPGHLHILFNGLQDAVMGLPIAKDFLDNLKVVESFLHDKQLRRKFQVSCLTGKPCFERFSSYSRTHIEWRWEFLSKALDKLVPLFHDLKANFDVGKITQGETGVVKVLLAKQTEQVLGKPYFVEFLEMVRVVGKSVETLAHRLEGCHCHGALLQQRLGLKRTRAALKDRTGKETCIWKGRQGPWFVMSGREELYNAIRHSSSDRLNEWVGAMKPKAQANLLALQLQLRDSLVATYKDKFKFWDSLPWKVVGVYSCCAGGGLTEAKRVAAECVREYDEAILAGKGAVMHRLAHHCFKPETMIRSEIDMFASSDSPLENFPSAFVALQEYSLVSLTERRIEQETYCNRFAGAAFLEGWKTFPEVHSLIDKVGRSAGYVLPPYMCSKLRERANLSTLSSCEGFYQLCLGMWRSRTLLDEILHQRLSPADLNSMTRLAKIKSVYQCTLASEYADTRESRNSDVHWKVARPDTRPMPASLPDSWNVAAVYWKNALVKGGCFCMPRSLLDACCRSDFDVNVCGDLAFRGLSAASDPILETDIEGDMCFFQVINAWPEKGQYVSVGHAPTSKWLVNVAMFEVFSIDVRAKQGILFRAADSAKSLDVRGLVASMRSSLAEVCRLRYLGRRGAWRPKALPPASSYIDSYMLPTDVSSAVGAPQASAPPLADSLAPVADTRDLRTLDALCGLARSGDSTSSVLLKDLETTDLSSVDSLARSGAIVVELTASAELRARVNWGSLERCVLHSVGELVPACRIRLASPVLQTSKYEWLLRLEEEGFQADSGVTGAFTARSELAYCSDLRRPASYFAALVNRQMIFEKGVLRIEHHMPDGYYKALLVVPSAKLASLLNNLAEKDNRWFLDAIKDCGHSVSDSAENEQPQGRDEADEAPRLVLEDDPGEVELGIFAPTVQPSGWTRVLADMGEGTPVVKIYFDHFTHSSGLQRGWVNCSVHGCICYRTCDGDKVSFCTRMYLWVQAADLPRCQTKPEHLRYAARERDVENAKRQIRLVDF